MDPLRILKVMPFFEPATQFGGVVSQAGLVCAELAARGHVVRVITTDIGQAASLQRDRWIERDGYLCYYARTRPWHRVVPYWTPCLATPIRQTMPETQIAALNVGLTLTNRLAAGLARSEGVPFVYNAEGALCPERLRLKRLGKALFLRLVERPLLRQAAACQAVTDKEVGDLLGQGVPRERIARIPNGVRPLHPAGGPAFRSRHGIPSDVPLLLYLGRLHRIKGLDLLIETFAKSQMRDTHLLLAGRDEDGSGQAALAMARDLGVADRVIAIGHIEPAEQLEALDAADLFVLTSRSEGLPNAILEALSAGLPCLLTEPCHVPEVATAGAGRVLPLDAALLAEALDEMLADREALGQMGEAARRLASDEFSLSSVVDSLETLYRQVIEDPARVSTPSP